MKKSIESTGAKMITAERLRQLKPKRDGGEGWSRNHDSDHIYGELAKAGACYAIHSVEARHLAGTTDYAKQGPVGEWPWEDHWWKPRNRVKDLVRAGALIAAEIDRLLNDSGETK